MPPLQPIATEPSAPLGESAPIQAQPAAPKKKLLEDLAERQKHEEAEREKSWRAVYRWQGRKLHAYSLGREQLWQSMCEREGGLSTAGGWLLLLYLCATAAEELEAGDVSELIAAAEKWSDEQVPRWQTQDAVALAQTIWLGAQCMRSRLKPSDHKSDRENAAWPVWQASYVIMVSAAVQGALTPWQIEWELPLAQGRALCHGRWIYDGAATLWMDKEASKTGAWLAAYKERHLARQAGRGALFDRLPG